jgi:dTDP-4-amino-4,6-dideoxygalactose transaminase
LDEIQAAFLDIKLKYLDSENQIRRQIAQYYFEYIKNPKVIMPIPDDYLLNKYSARPPVYNTKINTPASNNYQSNNEIFFRNHELNINIQINRNLPTSILNIKSHVWHLFVIRHPDRDKLQHHLANNGIQTLIHYPIAPHKQMAYSEYNEISLPITEKLHREVLSLPMSPVLSDQEIELIVNSVNDFL